MFLAKTAVAVGIGEYLIRSTIAKNSILPTIKISVTSDV
jgi:hypothetical protein